MEDSSQLQEPEKISRHEYNRQYYEKNQEALKRKKNAYYHANREAVLQKAKERYKRQKEELKIAQSQML